MNSRSESAKATPVPGPKKGHPGPPQTPSNPSPPMLSQILREQLRVRRYALRTEQTYVTWVRDFIRFHHGRHPRSMGPAEVRDYLTHLASTRQVAAATQRQALNALVFLYNPPTPSYRRILCATGRPQRRRPQRPVSATDHPTHPAP